ncbi:DUF2218 domain-containing protein [Sinomonas terrae]|uniref:DUF2218 domain-containing protein n=1 Tax=Sinomonas terrae TaxID=2908838 RepID=A0ABS9U4E4_9MICC|nr:DUF2218 domain-containing protein [Sinomonas terrae]MCH6471561.1 DUF2218 domain-containing protein [Sinomonas terrae]
MPTSEARIATDRASRYLVQLCSHLGLMGRLQHRPLLHHGGGMPPEVQQVDYTDTSGTVRLLGGTWALEATGDALMLRVDADDDVTLERLQAGIATRLEKIGRRDGLSVV